MAISIAKEWKGYKRAVLSPTASQIHLDDLKKAFYAGAVSILDTVMQFGEATRYVDAFQWMLMF